MAIFQVLGGMGLFVGGIVALLGGPSYLLQALLAAELGGVFWMAAFFTK